VIKAKKSLGQNFLTDQNIIDKILNVVEIGNKNILEIGPGTGNLTSAILNKNPKKLIVVEKDNNLADLLKDNFKKKIKVINKDVLEINEGLLDDEILTVFGIYPIIFQQKF
jgi:Dimethyladenosine transferase (rRNA methylation)